MPNDQENWERAVAAAAATYAGLPPDRQEELRRLITDIMGLKERLVQLVTAAGSSQVCRSCGGECCLLGKYHVSVLDIMAYQLTGTAPVTPDFTGHPACPYSDSRGCLMPSGYRPLTCVVFNCQPVEDLLDPAALRTFTELEASLRAAINSACQLCGARLDRPLLLSLH